MYKINNKKLRRYPNSVVSLAFNSEGTHLAIASSYQFEEKNKEYFFKYLFIILSFVPPDTIYIRKLKDNECMQRPT